MTRMGKRGWIAIGIAAILIVAAVVTAIVLILRKNYTPVDQIDLNEYSLVGVEFERDYYLNEPNPSGTLVFRNEAGIEKRAQLSEAEVTGLSTDEVGSFVMTATVQGQSIRAQYRVIYKDVQFKQEAPLCISIRDAFELDTMYADCIDYEGKVAARVTLREIFSGQLSLGEVTETVQTTQVAYHGKAISLDYSVGYLGYGNLYRGKDSVTDGDKTYTLEKLELFLESETRADVSGTEATGHGYLTVVVNGADLEQSYEQRNFNWSYDEEADKLYFDLNDGSACEYDLSAHVLRLETDVLFTSKPLQFGLEYVPADEDAA